MELRQLKYVLAIADSGLSVTIAARRLNTLQPGVSKQLKLLEEELGTRIFERNGKNFVSITKAGQRILVHARMIVQEVERIRSLTQDLARSGMSEPPAKNASDCNGSAVARQKVRSRRAASRRRCF